MWFYKNQNKDASTVKQTDTSSKSEAKTEPEPTGQSDEYAGWESYANAEYGFNYRYPATWTKADESKPDPARSATKQELSTGLKLTEERKYNHTVVVEVLDQPLADAVKWYDTTFAQSDLNEVSKTNGQLKGKDAVSYKVTNSLQDVKLYLFAVGSKTLSFGSVNEELNVQTDSNYWKTFDKVFNSLSIN